ncbi:hypothetical protein ABL78_8461 [Leptomonas seymouri]|uniref:Uncharacterized protein n=1 Tax=Leptomonas seymouri TaxID=5684 RepID=A0A0N0P247_LEPSE|nr:hypothetical protein ABL78_8461 [Leptomonas seymouri]|eukprot:KPI82529.1 hypothetical protein ABL78_8461 [Leptomonas seymouri]
MNQYYICVILKNPQAEVGKRSQPKCRFRFAYVNTCIDKYMHICAYLYMCVCAVIAQKPPHAVCRNHFYEPAISSDAKKKNSRPMGASAAVGCKACKRIRIGDATKIKETYHRREHIYIHTCTYMYMSPYTWISFLIERNKTTLYRFGS